MPAADLEEAVRAAAFAHLDRLLAGDPDRELASRQINACVFEGRPLPLIVQTGIWKPAMLTAALSIRTTYSRPDQPPPYLDLEGPDGRLRYKFRGHDPNHSDNRALRQAMTRDLPLIYFVGVNRGTYLARYPVWIIAEDAQALEFTVALDEAQRGLPSVDLSWHDRDYALRITRQRLHQPVFRSRVLHAYTLQCAICALRHAELLDAAHILPDGHPRGLPVVPNGVALCKIHHAAYDRNILGIRPDLVVEVQSKVLREVDGPMLRHGLQEMAGRPITTPRSQREQPDRDRLEERYEQFRQAG